jgi:hypothetical protein
LKKTLWFILGVITCLAVAAGAYFWATDLITSLYNYRSPLHAKAPQAGQPVGPSLSHKVVLVLIDALRNDTSLNTSVMPYLNQLRTQGAYAIMHSRPPSYSEPGYSVLLTGAWPDISDGPAMNLDYPDIPTWTQDNLFSAAHHAGLTTAVSGYNWFEKLIPQADVTDSFYTAGEDAAADQDVIAAALPMLNGSDRLVLIHIDQVDFAGHYQGGPIDPRWNQAAARSDTLLQEIASKLDLSKDTLVIFSDHGQIDRGGHGGQDPIVLIEPFVMVGAGVKPGRYADIQMVDVAPTMAVLLGTNLPASNEGHPLTDMLSVPAAELATIQGELLTQQAQLLSAYLASIGAPAQTARGTDVVSSTQAVIDQARAARVNHERIGRILLAILIAAIPAVVLILRKQKKALWLLGGALVYAGLFNLRYAVLSGRTYSLSSVASKTEVILYTAVTAAASLAIVWLFLAFWQKYFRQGPSRAAASTLGLTLMTIYVLVLPILLGFALNGILVGWTLPDFLSMFLSFLSIIQSLVVAVLGLLLTGISAAIAAFVPKARRLV